MIKSEAYAAATPPSPSPSSIPSYSTAPSLPTHTHSLPFRTLYIHTYIHTYIHPRKLVSRTERQRQTGRGTHNYR